jgi:hypothetical protein
MVRQGAAWIYQQYNKDKSLLAVEAEAKAAKRGLWSLPEAERAPPWEWRKQVRQQGQTHKAKPIKTTVQSYLPTQTQTSANCRSKRYCKQMANCAEAQYYLHQCGLTRLDGDGDGVPCESLCR